MRHILAWSEDELDGLSKSWGLTHVLTEVGAEGTILREIGFDAAGTVAHRHPGSPSKTSRGVFDGAAVEPAAPSDVDPADFDRLWFG